MGGTQMPRDSKAHLEAASPRLVTSDASNSGIVIAAGSATDVHLDSQAPSDSMTLAKDAVEFSKLVTERDKLAFELEQIKAGARTPLSLRAKSDIDEKKEQAELEKLLFEARNAKWSNYFELAKATVPAIGIGVSILIAGLNIAYQQNKDRTSEISEQLSKFNDKIANKDKDPFVQKNAISGITSLKEHSIPSLLTNLDLNHTSDIHAAVEAALLRLNEDTAIQRTLATELLSSIKYVTIRRLGAHDVDRMPLERYLDLWAECMRFYKTQSPALYRELLNQGADLASDLERRVRNSLPADQVEEPVALLQRLKPN